MAKILGLDLGTNSIGWAVVDTSEKKIVDTGVRTFLKRAKYEPPKNNEPQQN
jgi:CRISPR-associated endonuclease Csn1